MEIDIYLPHYSELGVPVAELMQHSRPVQGFKVLELEYLLTLKIFTLSRRGRSDKGRKDFLDIVSLYRAGQADPKRIQLLLKAYNLSSAWRTFQQFLKEHTQIPELDLNAHAYAKLKRDILNT